MVQGTNTSTPDEDELLTIRQVAKRLHVDETTVRRWIKEHYINAIELPHKPGAKRVPRRIKRSTLDAILSQQH